MPEEPRIVISSEPTIGIEEIARRTFVTTFRGYDPGEVRTFLQRVADELAGVRERERELRRRLDEAERRPLAVDLDEATLTSALGVETARVLRSAREAAADITAKAEEKVARLVREAEEEAAQVRTEAEAQRARRLEEAEEVAAGIRRAAEADAEAMRARSRAEAEAELDAARTKGRELVSEAEALRERVLGDLARRRRLASAQVEQLRVGRERLLEAYRVVKRTLDGVFDELNTAEVEARAAAEAAGRRVAAEAEISVEELEAELAAGRVAGLVPGPPLASSSEEPSTAEGPIVVKSSASPLDANGLQSGAGVDELFARIKADRARAVARAHEVLESSTGVPAQASATGPSSAAPGATSAPTDAPRSVEEARLVTLVQVPVKETNTTEAPEGEAVSDADELILQQRDALLERGDAALLRRLKRVLQDDQNRALDAVRTAGPSPSVELVLPSLDQQLERYQEVAEAPLVQAAEAGLTYAGMAPDMARAGHGLSSVRDLARQLALDLVIPLRERLERGFQEAAVSPGDEGLLTERLGTAYRECKRQRLEPLARQAIAVAFSRAAFEATAEGSRLRWVVEDDGGPCPDCDDNVLAGPTVKGEPFPTGQLYPPAHGGCRCLLVPVPQ